MSNRGECPTRTKPKSNVIMDLLEKRTKGQEGPHLRELTGAGFNIAWTTTRALALQVEARQDDFIK